MLSDSQKRLVELDKKKDEVKKFFDDYSAAIEAVVKEHGLGSFFQDGEGTVYTTTIPEGRFVYFDKLSVKRTRRAGEERGDLSLTDARKAGLIVEGK